MEDLLRRVLPGPTLDKLVELLGVLHTVRVGLVAWILGQLGTADGLHEPFKDSVAVPPDGHVGTVPGAVRVARRNTRESSPGPLADDLRHVVLWNHRFHQAEDRLVECRSAPAPSVLSMHPSCGLDRHPLTDTGCLRVSSASGLSINCVSPVRLFPLGSLALRLQTPPSP